MPNVYRSLQLIKSFSGGSRGAVFSKSAPLVAEGKMVSMVFLGGLKLRFLAITFFTIAAYYWYSPISTVYIATSY
jgi:hypothetical protein